MPPFNVISRRSGREVTMVGRKCDYAAFQRHYKKVMLLLELILGE